MQPFTGERYDGTDVAVPAQGSLVRRAVHVPTGLRFRFLVDGRGNILCSTVEAKPEDIPEPDLLFRAIKFCEEYLSRARNRLAN